MYGIDREREVVCKCQRLGKDLVYTVQCNFWP